MKKLALLLMTGLFSVMGTAQIATPAASPGSTLEQVVGLTNVKVEYSRPGMRGRTVFGDLVPYDKLWRTGANKNTTVTFSEDVTVMGKELKAGSYAIFTTPGESVWEVIFYSDTENWGTPQNWDASKVAASVKVEVIPMPVPIETFTITIDDVTDNGAVIGILWEEVYVGVPFEVPTDKAVMASIDKVLNGPSGSDYFNAAVYYMNSGKDIQQSKKWMDKAMEMTEKPAYWMLRQQSLVYAKAGDKKGAIEAAKKSLAGAEEAGNADYVKMNKDSLKEWGGM